MENIFIELDCFRDIIHLDGEMVDAVNLHAHWDN
jgi:hypothetical protein